MSVGACSISISISIIYIIIYYYILVAYIYYLSNCLCHLFLTAANSQETVGTGDPHLHQTSGLQTGTCE